MNLLTSTRIAALATLATAATLSLVNPASTHAGTYVHRSCATAGDIGDATSGWQPFTTVSDVGVYSFQACGSSSEPRLESDMYPANAVPSGKGTGWKYQAPLGTSISAITASYAGLSDPAASTGRSSIQLVNANGGVFLKFNGSVSASSAQSITWPNLDTQSVTWQTVCDSGPACTGSVGWAALYEPHLSLADRTPPTVNSQDGTLIDDKLVGDEHLTYTASDSGGGIARLRLYVDEVLSDVDHVIDENGGICRPSGSENGAWVFSRPRPCPLTVTDDETIDTTKIPDGSHVLTFKILDAAQNEKQLWSGRRLIANHPPVNGGLPSFRNNSVYAGPLVGMAIEAVDDGSWDGPDLSFTRKWEQCNAAGEPASCAAIPGATGLSYTPTVADVGHRLRLVVTATNPADKVAATTAPSGIVARPASVDGPTTSTPTPDDGTPVVPVTPVAPVTPTTPSTPSTPVAPVLPVAAPLPPAGHTLRGRVVGEAGCPQDKATLRFEHVAGGKVKLGYGKRSTAQLQLTCTSNGKPIEAAHLDVFTRVGSGAAVASDIVTDGAGHATLRLAAGAGRSVAVGYRMYSDDPIARATAALKVTVDGRVRLRGNHRTLHNGRALTLRGRLLGGHVPRRGVTLTVQWKDHHRWRPFAQIKTNRKGTFSYAYRFTRTNSRITYRLRVQVSKGQLDYPFQPVASNAVKVIVGP